MKTDKYSIDYTIGGVQLNHGELLKKWELGNTVLLSGFTAYSISLHVSGFRFMRAHRSDCRLSQSGRYHLVNPADANRAVGFDLFIEACNG